MSADTAGQFADLQANLVPHREWAVRRWFYANPLWYYHRPSTDHNLCLDGRFFRLVDPLLREVCHALNESGVRTTPSCEGHSYPQERFERIWEELQNEAGFIRGAGLVVKDCESDQTFRFHNDAYQLPWASFESFYGEAAAHQNLGYLGMLFPQSRQRLAASLQDSLQPLASLSMESHRNEQLQTLVVGAHVNAIDPCARAATWNQFTARVKAVLEGQAL